ncbi:hypothetical protein JTB14_037027 [Gonioctena quinquepunctata]|nr:hypothetical protein JTB14_037027 [Gonioctena quinquepunctata]
MQSTTVEESKYCPTNFLENMNFNGFADEWAKPKVNYFDNGVISKNEDEDCTDDLSTNNVESKMERLKTECDIDIVYENVKFQICEEKSSGKNDKVLGTEIETDFSRELSKDSGENMDFNGLIGDLAKPKVIDNGVIIKTEDEVHSDCTEDSSAGAELKTEIFKTECDIDILYEDVKPQICEEKSSRKNENESHLNYVTDKIIKTEIGPTFSRELLKDSQIWPQQSIEDDGKAPEWVLQVTTYILLEVWETLHHPKPLVNGLKKNSSKFAILLLSLA